MEGVKKKASSPSIEGWLFLCMCWHGTRRLCGSCKGGACGGLASCVYRRDIDRNDGEGSNRGMRENDTKSVRYLLSIGRGRWNMRYNENSR
jgi:hypothetical protein